MNNKVVIIGCGNVGMSYAYALLNQKTPVSELVLIEGLLREKFPDVFEYNRSRPTLLELQMKGVNKSILIDTFKDYYRQKGKELTLYVCGDNENDIEMLKKADVSVCPANAIDAVKAISERCLCSNNEGLLADLIYSF